MTSNDKVGYDYSQGDDEGDATYALRIVDRCEQLERALAEAGEEIKYWAERARVAPSHVATNGHDWQPDGGKLAFESHPGGEAPHVHATCSKCGGRAWFTELQWEMLGKGCAAVAPSSSGQDLRERLEITNEHIGRLVHAFDGDRKELLRRIYKQNLDALTRPASGSKSAPMPTADDFEAALRSEYGGTPDTDALLDVVLPMLRDHPSLTSSATAPQITPLTAGEYRIRQRKPGQD